MEASANTQNNDTIIYKHITRDDWGEAILAWERHDRRGYQFEDGKLRIFKAGWYDRLLEVDKPLPKAIATAGRLRHKLGLEPTSAAKKLSDTVSFEDQLLVLRHLYPDGIGGAKWLAEKRGTKKSRRLKRHRDPAVADARATLSATHLDAWIESGDFGSAWGAILGVLDATDLVISRHVAPLRRLGADAKRDLVVRVRDLLWGEEGYEIRFERYVAALAMATKKKQSWQLATALSALVHPDEHVCVRPTAARAQAAWMAPRLRWSKNPDAALYMRLCDMASAVRAELADNGERPADLLDVHDFMWVTLRPTARKKLEELRAPSADDGDIASADADADVAAATIEPMREAA